jgi:hypothetical protein
MRQRPHHQIPRIQAVGRLALGAEVFRGVELRLDCGDDRLGDFVLHLKHVGELAVIALGPDMASCGDVVELGCDANAIAPFTHAALEHVTDAEFIGDLLHVHGLALVVNEELRAITKNQRNLESAVMMHAGHGRILHSVTQESFEHVVASRRSRYPPLHQVSQPNCFGRSTLARRRAPNGMKRRSFSPRRPPDPDRCWA